MFLVIQTPVNGPRLPCSDRTAVRLIKQRPESINEPDDSVVELMETIPRLLRIEIQQSEKANKITPSINPSTEPESSRYSSHEDC